MRGGFHDPDYARDKAIAELRKAFRELAARVAALETPALTDTPPPGVEDQKGSSSQVKPQPPRAAPTSGAVTNSNADLKG